MIYYSNFESNENLEARKQKINNFEDDQARFNSAYHFNEAKFILLIKDKKQWYLVLEGVDMEAICGFYAKKLTLFETMDEVKEYIKEKNHLLCHVWHFDYDEMSYKKIFGEFDEFDRVYMVKENGYYLAKTVIDEEYDECEYPSVEHAIDSFENGYLKGHVKIYESKEELKAFYGLE